MDFISFIEFAKVAYHLYLTETLEEYEMVEYLWEAEADVISYDEELVVNFKDEEDAFVSTITILPSMEVSVDTNLGY